jgi:hypothetical protein
MTQIVTISANTAALNIETLRAPRRVSVKDQVRDVKADADQNLKRAENVGDPLAVGPMAPAVSVGISFMAADQQPPQQYLMQQVERAYRDLADE